MRLELARDLVEEPAMDLVEVLVMDLVKVLAMDLVKQKNGNTKARCLGLGSQVPSSSRMLRNWIHQYRKNHNRS